MCPIFPYLTIDKCQTYALSFTYQQQERQQNGTHA
jgi:hypothetical protein